LPFPAQLRALFEHSIDGILLTIPDGQILAANPAACALLGRTESELALGIRHHMNNALAAARLELEVGLASTPLASPAAEVVASLQQHLSRMTAIVRRLDRVEELEPVPYLGKTMMSDVSADT